LKTALKERLKLLNTVKEKQLTERLLKNNLYICTSYY
jgi:hypothetical protein